MSKRPSKAHDPIGSLLLGGDELLDGRYRLIRRIGVGGYGIVYEVEHDALQKRFALKVLNHQVSRRDETVRRFKQEAQATAKIAHPNIVSVTDFGTTESGQVYFVMELLNGETLSRVLRREQVVTLSRAIPILAATCHALEATHRLGIVHRDLKPANIFLVPQEDIERGRKKDLVKILDFGLAKMLAESLQDDPISQSGKAYGTAGYMAPELLRGEEITPGADIYSLGCIAFEMFAGRPVFTGKEPMALAVAHCKKKAPLVRKRNPAARIPEQMEQLIDRCLQKRPELRFGSCRELLEELRGFTRKLLTPDGTTRVEIFGRPHEGGIGSGWRIDTTKKTWWEDFSVPAETPLRLGLARFDTPNTPASPASPALDGPTQVDPNPAARAARHEAGLPPLELTPVELVTPAPERELASTPAPALITPERPREHEPISEEVTDPKVRLTAEELQFSAAISAPAAVLADDRPQPGPTQARHILVVEPDVDVVHELRPRLDQSGLRAEYDIDCRDALRLIRRDPPDLLVLAVELPGEVNGYQLCDKLKTDSTLWQIPVVLLHRAEDKRLGAHRNSDTCADAYLPKPVHPNVLLGKVDQLLTFWREQQLAIRPAPPSRPEPPSQPEPAGQRKAAGKREPARLPAAPGRRRESTPRDVEPSGQTDVGWHTHRVPALRPPRSGSTTKLLILILSLLTILILGVAVYLLLEPRLGRDATLVLVVTPADAEARLDGRPLPQRGENRVVERLRPGRYSLELHRAGCRPQRRQVTLASGKIAVSRIDLRCAR